MGDNRIEESLKSLYREEILRKARQLLRASAPVYFYVDSERNIHCGLRVSQNSQGSQKTVHVTASIPWENPPSGKCDLCRSKSAECIHCAAGLIHAANYNKIITNEDNGADFKRPSFPGMIPVYLKELSERVRSQKNYDAKLEVDFLDGFPHAPGKWDKLNVLVKLFQGGREFSGSMNNLRQLQFKETTSGILRISQFSPQERQIIRYLALNGDMSENSRIVFNSETGAEFFHCLSGFDRIYAAGKKINVNRFPAEPVLAHSERAEKHSLYPAMSAGSMILPFRGASIITGRSGVWVGVSGDYWWLPATADLNIIKQFIRTSLVVCDAEDAKKIISEFSTYPFRAVSSSRNRISDSPMVPAYRIESTRLELRLLVQFNYSGNYLSPGRGILWVDSDGGSASRDKSAEKRCEEELICFGFACEDRKKGIFVIKDSEAMGVFLEKVIPIWKSQGREFFLSPGEGSPTSLLSGTPALKPEFEKVSEDDESIRARCAIRSGEHVIPWKELQGPVRDGKKFAIMPSGLPARISDELAEFATAVRDISKQDGNDKWFIRIPRAAAPYWDEMIMRLLPQLGFRLCGEKDDEKPSDEALLVPGFNGNLRKYQEEGLRWMNGMLRKKYNFILADEMGLGKTIQALALVAQLKASSTEPPTSLVVCPSSLVENWQMEAAKFVPKLKVLAIKGNQREGLWETATDYDLVIMSYAILKRDSDHCEGIKFLCAFLDEAQHIKNPGTENAKCSRKIRARHRILLSGTPLENSPSDLWSVFDFLHPGMLGTLRHFKSRYESKDADESRQSELGSRIGPFIIRRKKLDVAAELPERSEQTVFFDLEPEQREIYDRILRTGREECLRLLKEHGGRMHVLTCLLRLRQLCCHPMLLPPDLRPPDAKSAKTELLKELLLENIDSGHKTLVFSQFTSMLKIVRDWLGEMKIECEYLDGSTQDRMQHVMNFNNEDKYHVFLLSLKAGGCGLNLTAADRVIIYDPWWNPAVEAQAADRAHRIGQTKNVSILRLVGKDTIEERVLQLHERKKLLFTNLVENASLFRNLTDDDIEFLLNPE